MPKSSAGAGIAMPFLPLPIEYRSLFYCMIFFALAALAHFVIRWMFAQQFGLAANAIRDDEDKAEAMGIPTLKYKLVGHIMWVRCSHRFCNNIFYT